MISETVPSGLKLNASLPVSEFGKNYEGYYHSGMKAVKKVLSEKAGQVTGAFNHKVLGDIDIVWGKVTNQKLHKGFGLVHILDKHPNFNVNLISKVIRYGTLEKRYKGFTIRYGQYKLGIKDGYEIDKKRVSNNRWIVTSFEEN